ncbi:nitroreductase family protein [Liquorilactobacillus capillatus]|uniref:NADH dehydrogenase n=1 Tax=Liquorilactobacillus capillatus DSM 19910 TaxID=1423731 RepID=A0A0R1LX38_9LACO|nr:nitroreductase family protein [Liquorilactobacillus capillatus]KRL00278.1 NADH dehydrogenase [Liquorilactobacillus capillatus DSM 19910]
MSFLDKLDNRRSIRHFMPDIEISEQEILAILNHAAKAPSNNNSQPWKVIVIKNQALKNKLKELSFGQAHVASAAAVFLILGDKSYYDINRLVRYSIEHHLINEDQAEDKRQRITTYFTMHPEDKEVEGLRLDVGLFCMNLMHVLRAFGYDSVPMRGVDFKQLCRSLNIAEELTPIMLLPVGKALTGGHRHIRESAQTFTTIIN